MHANILERKVNRMIGKRQLIAFVMVVALIGFGVLNLDTVRLSAYESPAIYISPAYVSSTDPLSEIGANHTFYVYTDYDGSDVWGFEFGVTYDTNVLEGVEVVNGGLINETIMWLGEFNNTKGTLDVGNSFYTPPLEDPPITSGPGILTNITFTVVGYGVSNITFVDRETRLIGAYEVGGEWEQYNIIDDSMMGHIEGSVFENPNPGDCDVDRDVDYDDFIVLAGAYGSSSGEPAYDGRADFDRDGDVDYDDFINLAGNYGTSA